MISVLMEAALRALVVAAAVWAGLRIFRVRNVVAEKLAWSVVLAAALVMPLLMPLAARLAVPAAVIPLPRLATAASPAGTLPITGASIAGVPSDANSAARSQDSAASGTEPAPVEAALAPRFVQAIASVSPARLAGLLYAAVAGLLLLRLLLGLAAAARLWRRAHPVSSTLAGRAGGLQLRWTAAVSSPITIGSGVLLPADYSAWDEEKLRVVLAHERSHLRQRDFYLQLLAGLYAALVWFSPLGWWLKRKLSDLGEAISDRCGAEEAASRASYAQVLLEIAAAPRSRVMQLNQIGVAMARSSKLAHRMERLLNDTAFRQAFAFRRRAFVAALVLPTVLIAAAALVRVEAASQAQEQHAPAVSAASISASGQSASGQAAKPTPNGAPAPTSRSDAAEHSAVHVDVPAIHVDVPAVHVNMPERHIDVPAVHVDVPATHVDVPAQHIDVPATHVNVPAIHIDVPAAGEQDNSGGHAAYGPSQAAKGGELLAMLDGFGHIFGGQSGGSAAEASFDRTLTVSGTVDLHVATGFGNIHLMRGAAGQVKIHAIVRSHRAEDASEVRSIAANPPIEQTKNIIRIGGQQREGMNHISIDYEIQAPADAALNAISGSGDIKDEGVGQDAKLMTGSGDIQAAGLEGGFTAQTGSGNMTIENTGKGDAKAQTGSGNIDVSGVDGALKAQTGSGDIKAAGRPTAEWRLETGSGSIEFTPGSAPVTIDASAGSGSISSDHAIAAQTAADRHHLHGQLNGGGPEVRMETGSGDIRIH